MNILTLFSDSIIFAGENVWFLVSDFHRSRRRTEIKQTSIEFMHEYRYFTAKSHWTHRADDFLNYIGIKHHDFMREERFPHYWLFVRESTGDRWVLLLGNLMFLLLLVLRRCWATNDLPLISDAMTYLWRLWYNLKEIHVLLYAETYPQWVNFTVVPFLFLQWIICISLNVLLGN